MGGKSQDSGAEEAATKSGKFSLQQAREEALANRPNQYTPFGSIEWTRSQTPQGYDASRWGDVSGQGFGDDATSQARLAYLANKGNKDAQHEYFARTGEIVGRPNSILGVPETHWTQEFNLNDDYQTLLDQQTDTISQQQLAQQEALRNLQEQGQVDLGQFGQMDMSQYGQADLSQFGDAAQIEYDPNQLRTQAQDAAWNYATNRLDPRFERQNSELETRLRAQGLRPGDQAYDAQMSSFNNSRNDAYEQAMFGSYGEGRAEADQLWNQAVQGAGFFNDTRQQDITNFMGNRAQGFQQDMDARQAAIENYLRGRGQSLDEYTALNPSETIGATVDAFSGE